MRSWVADECPHSVSDRDPTPVQITAVQKPNMLPTMKIFSEQESKLCFFSPLLRPPLPFRRRPHIHTHTVGMLHENKQKQSLSSGLFCQNLQPQRSCCSPDSTLCVSVCLCEGYREWQTRYGEECDFGNFAFLEQPLATVGGSWPLEKNVKNSP